MRWYFKIFKIHSLAWLWFYFWGRLVVVWFVVVLLLGAMDGLGWFCFGVRLGGCVGWGGFASVGVWWLCGRSDIEAKSKPERENRTET